MDRPEDFLVVKAILENMYHATNGKFGTSDIKRFLDSKPVVFNLNTGIIRNEGLTKSLREEKEFV